MATPTPASRQVTAVNTGTDTLTATGVGFLPGGVTTGDRIRLQNVGGALPASTPSLAPVTDYFAIRVSDDTIKVAVSSSDAVAGTAVNITGAGTGTHFIQVGLPYCVPRIAAPLTQVHSDDDNAAWNALVALYDMLSGQTQSIWPNGHGLRPDIYPGCSAIDQGGVAPSRDITTGSLTSNGVSAHIYALRTRPGDHLLSVVIAAFGNASADASVALIKVTAGGVPSTVASGTILNAPASWNDYTFSGTATVGARDALFLTYSPTAAGLVINNVALNYDHPSS